MIELTWAKEKNEMGWTMWVVRQKGGNGPERIAEAKTKSKALRIAMERLGFSILDEKGWPPGKIAYFETAHNVVRNVAVLRTGLHALYKEVKKLEQDLKNQAELKQGLDVNGPYAMMAMKFDWFSVSMLNLVEGVSVLNTLAHEETGDYVTVASQEEGMEKIICQARAYVKSVEEIEALRQWRNKIAAHRSGVSRPPEGQLDSMGTRLISLMGAQVIVKNGRYVAPGAMPAGVDPGSTAPELKEWSLTKTWEDIRAERYKWLENERFFESVNSLQFGRGARIHSLEVVSGEEAIRNMMRQARIKDGPWQTNE